MPQYILTISHKGKLEKLLITPGKKWVIKAQPGAQYQIDHPDEEALAKITAKLEQDQLVVDLANEDFPTVIIEDYGVYYPKNVAVSLSEKSAILGATENPIILAATDSTSLSMANVALGVGAVAGATLLGSHLFDRGRPSASKSTQKQEAKDMQNVTDNTATTPADNKPIGENNGTSSKPDDTNKLTEVITPTAVNILLNPLSEDGTIHANEFGDKVVISGKLVADREITSGKVAVKLGDTFYPAELNADNTAFRVEIMGKQFDKRNHIDVFAEVNDGDALGKISLTQYYDIVGLVASKIEIDPIDQDDLINRSSVISNGEEKATLTISGKVSNDDPNALAKVGDIVTLTTGESVFSGALYEESGELRFSIAVDTHNLLSHQRIKATVATQDAAGNTQTGTAYREYTADIDLTQPTITINPITPNDNVINQKEAEMTTTTLSGKVANVDKDVDNLSVSIEIAGEKRVAAYDAQHHTWSLEVAMAELVALAHNGAEPNITAHVEVTDRAGNTQSNQTMYNFGVDTVLNEPRLSFNDVTDHNIINVEESRAATTTLSGTVELDADVNLDKLIITVAVGDEKLPAIFNKADKSWNLVVETEKLIALTDNTEGQKSVTVTISVEDLAGNTKEISVGHQFVVENVATIDIEQIGENFTTNLSKSTRIYGNIEFDGVYALGKNNYQVKWINLNIGEKSYSAGFNSKEKSFFVDIDNAELASLHGKSISVDFVNPSDSDLAPKMFAYRLEAGGAGDYAIRKTVEMPRVKTLTLTTSDNNASILNSGDSSYTVNKPNADTITIHGTVGGVAKEHDVVEITVGDKTYSTQVTAENRFSVNALAQDLQYGDGKVRAVLKTQDLSGKEIQATDVEFYARPNAVSSDNVTPHEKVTDPKIDHTQSDYNFPYFIKQVANNLEIDRSAFGETRVVKYQFVDAKDIVNGKITTTQNPNIQGSSSTEPNSFVDYSDAHKNTIRAVYNKIGEFINVQFIEVPTSEKTLELGEGTRLFRAKLAGSFANSSAFAFPNGDLIWNDTEGWHSGDGKNAFTSYTAFHEITHTLWMVHSKNDWTGQPKPNMEYEDSSEFTNMSYRTASTNDYRSLRLFDLAFLHYRYGVNKTQRTDNNIYSFKDYNIVAADGGRYIWDGGGVDTFDASAEKEGVNVNLTPGSWIYRGNELNRYFVVKGAENFTRAQFFEMPENTDFYTNFEGIDVKINTWYKNKNIIHYNAEYTEGQAFIGFGTQIENLIGSAHDDVLTGNKADNNIQGGAGDDVIKGGEGNDYLDGGLGNDILAGEAGNDVYLVDSLLDKVIEEFNQGTDTVLSLVDYTLTNNVENLQLLGTTASKATGNALDNILTANNIGNILEGGDGNDRLIGGLGADTLTGGNGKDVFVFNTLLNGSVDTITDFNITDDMIALSKAIFNVTADNLGDHIQYDRISGKLSYDADGQGEAQAIHFANLAPNLDEQMIMYEII